MGKHPSSTLVSFDIIDPAPKIKRLMALEDGVKVYCFTRVRNVDNEPLILETSYYPQHIYPNLTREMLERTAFTACSTTSAWCRSRRRTAMRR